MKALKNNSFAEIKYVKKRKGKINFKTPYLREKN